MNLIAFATCLFAGSLLTAAPGAAQAPRVVEWERGPALPTPAAGHAAAAEGDALWCVGGTTWSGGEKRWLADIVRWRRGDDAWRQVGAMPTGSAHGLGITANGAMYIVGGSDGDAGVADVYRLPLDGEPEVALMPPLPEPVALAAGGRVGDAIVVAGGTPRLSDLEAAHDRVYVWKPGTDAAWTPGPAMPGGPRAIAASVVCGDELLVFGGCQGDGADGVTNRSDAYAWSASTGAWRALAELPFPVRGAAAAAIDDRFVVLVGGYRTGPDASGFTDTVLIYDRQADRYTAATPLPSAVGVASVVVQGDRVYVIGGEDAPKSRSAAVLIGKLDR